jgi:hypothetical protein
MEETVKTAKPRGGPRLGPWLLYMLGRVLQVTGLMVTLVAATAFFGTPSTVAMLRMMLVGVILFVPGWVLARRDPQGR